MKMFKPLPPDALDEAIARALAKSLEKGELSQDGVDVANAALGLPHNEGVIVAAAMVRKYVESVHVRSKMIGDLLALGEGAMLVNIGEQIAVVGTGKVSDPKVADAIATVVSSIRKEVEDAIASGRTEQ